MCSNSISSSSREYLAVCETDRWDFIRVEEIEMDEKIRTSILFEAKSLT